MPVQHGNGQINVKSQALLHGGMGGASMAAVDGVAVAGATGRVARWGSRSPARPPLWDAAASPATAPWALEGRPRRGARRREGARRRVGTRHGN